MGGGGGGKFISSVGNLSVQYNLQALSVAIAVFGSSTEPGWAKNALSGVVFAGAFAGMISMGYLGDLMGRRIGMLTTLAFVVVGACACGLGAWGDTTALYSELAAYRFILGFGVGGIYPMAAATAAENKGDEPEDADDEAAAEASAARAAWSFFWQSVGAAVPYLIAWPLVVALNPDDSAHPASTSGLRGTLGRGIMLLGALPALVVLAATWVSRPAAPAQAGRGKGKGGLNRAPSYELADEDDDAGREAETGSSPIAVIKAHPQYLKALIGTGGTWFLYDISFYGINVYTPTILKMIYGSSEGLADNMWQGLLVSALGIPACALAIWILPRIGGRALNAYGFLLNGAAFLAMGMLFQLYPSAGAETGKFIAFCAAMASLNWGPNVGTYAVPCAVYPSAVRGTFHGLSAASGKLGAVVGAFLFPSYIDQFGVASLFFLQVGVNIAGAALSWALLPRKRKAAPQAGDGAEDDVYSSLLVQ